MRAVISMATLCVLIANPANAVRPDECEQQRAAFPKEWNDVSKEKPLFFCWSHYSGALKVTLGAGDKEGRRLMSLVPLSANDKKAKQDTSKDVFRVWLDREQTRSIGGWKVFRHHCSTEGFVLDSRSAVRPRRRSSRLGFLAGHGKSEIRQPRRRLVLQQGAEIQRVPGRLL